MTLQLFRTVFEHPLFAHSLNSYIHALEEDARFAEAKLRDVWRRHIRNPDDRGNPQLSAVLQVR